MTTQLYKDTICPFDGRNCFEKAKINLADNTWKCPMVFALNQGAGRTEEGELVCSAAASLDPWHSTQAQVENIEMSVSCLSKIVEDLYKVTANVD